jgi:hypothetical protein
LTVPTTTATTWKVFVRQAERKRTVRSLVLQESTDGLFRVFLGRRDGSRRATTFLAAFLKSREGHWREIRVDDCHEWPGLHPSSLEWTRHLAPKRSLDLGRHEHPLSLTILAVPRPDGHADNSSQDLVLSLKAETHTSIPLRPLEYRPTASPFNKHGGPFGSPPRERILPDFSRSELVRPSQTARSSSILIPTPRVALSAAPSSSPSG